MANAVNYFRKPAIPARFLPIGAIRERKQKDGSTISFKVVEIVHSYPDVPSKLDGYSSTWYTKEKRWVAEGS